MKCPRCQHVFSATPDASGAAVCPSCGARLRARPPAAAEAPAPDGALAEALRHVLGEIREVRKTQEQIVALLHAQARALPAREDGDEDEGPFHGAIAAETPVRSRRRKSVLLIDDDAQTREEAAGAMLAAEIPARAVGDGNAAISAIAEDRPDVVVLELGMGGSMAGKDVVNVIKATMEWVDIPIVLYTRLPIASQKEARQLHGADELVPKAPNGVDALVKRVIALFRRG
jgi:CheY-like chemotaxis protein